MFSYQTQTPSIYIYTRTYNKLRSARLKIVLMDKLGKLFMFTLRTFKTYIEHNIRLNNQFIIVKVLGNVFQISAPLKIKPRKYLGNIIIK